MQQFAAACSSLQQHATAVTACLQQLAAVCSRLQQVASSWQQHAAAGSYLLQLGSAPNHNICIIQPQFNMVS
eukprot:1049580-Karenia_brevis.AAC.1